MEAFFELPWRPGPALLMILVGSILAFRGLASMPNPTRPAIDLMLWMRGFRRTVAGLALLLVGVAWLYQIPWLLAVALGVGLQEIREASHYITTLQAFTRRRLS